MFSLHTWYWSCFTCLFAFRYVRLIINLYAFYIGYKPTPLPEKSPLGNCEKVHLGDVGDDEKSFLRYDRESPVGKDVSVVLATLGEDASELRITIQSALDNRPSIIILVTPQIHLKRIEAMMEMIHEPTRELIKVVTSTVTNKRQQLVCGLQEVQTPFVLLLDDDVKLPERFLYYALAPFMDEQVGGVGTNQRVRRSEKPSFWEFLGAIYLQRRNFDCTACNWLDGGVPCLSGRAVMYRSAILRDPVFMTEFKEESVSLFGKRYKLNADDDNFITRWLFKTGYKIRMQNHPDCEVETTLATDRNYLNQCVRWSRSNWRSNLTSLFTERDVWRLFPWSTYAVFLTTVTQWALAVDCLMVFLLYKAVSGWGASDAHTAYLLFLCWWIMSRFIKFVGYFRQYPMDLLTYGWLIIAFGYFHNGIKLFSLCTILNTDWGSREDADRAPDNKERLRRLQD